MCGGCRGCHVKAEEAESGVNKQGPLTVDLTLFPLSFAALAAHSWDMNTADCFALQSAQVTSLVHQHVHCAHTYTDNPLHIGAAMFVAGLMFLLAQLHIFMPH